MEGGKRQGEAPTRSPIDRCGAARGAGVRDIPGGVML